MFRLSLSLFLLVAVLPSCEEKHDAAGAADSGQPPPRRTTRRERSELDAVGRTEDFRRGLEAAKKRLSVQERDKDLVDMAWKAMESDLEIAGEAILGITSGSPEKILLIAAYVQALLEQGKEEEAKIWIAALDDQIDHQAATAKMEELAGSIRPEEDARQLSESHFLGDPDPAAVQVIQNWVAKDPDRAAQWLRNLPEGEGRSNGFKILLGAWVLRDSPSALSWIATQPNSQLRQEAMTGVVGFLNEQPAPIRENLLEGGNEAVKREILEQIAAMSPPAEIDSEPESGKKPQLEPESQPESGSDDAEDREPEKESGK